MEINWMLLVPGLLALFYPLDVWLVGQIRLRDYEHLRNERMGSKHAWWRQSWVWIDPMRAFVGGWMLRNAWSIEPPLPGIWEHLPLMATVIVMGLALVAQMHTRRDEDAFYAPIGFVAGLMFALLPPQVAVLVVVMAGACLMAFRGWAAFFFCGAIGAAVFGYMILRVDYWMAAAVVLILEPVLLSLLARRELVWPAAR